MQLMHGGAMHAEVEEEEEEELGIAETYAEYMPVKCKCSLQLYCLQNTSHAFKVSLIIVLYGEYMPTKCK